MFLDIVRHWPVTVVMPKVGHWADSLRHNMSMNFGSKCVGLPQNWRCAATFML